MSSTPDWKKHLEDMEGAPPSPLLLRALPYVVHKGKAIDLGAGALKDSRHLLEEGFEVMAVDREEAVVELATAIGSDKLQTTITQFADLTVPTEEYDIATAMFSLPFVEQALFNLVFENIKRTLVEGGIFSANVFGVNDEWNPTEGMTFHTKEQVEELLNDMDILFIEEGEKDGRTADGKSKHWHTISFIAQKHRE